MRLRAGFVGAICFVVGAATSGLFLSRAVAQGKPAHARFEYQCSIIGRSWEQAAQSKFNALGAEGWELASSQGDNVFCFKRQLP